MMGDVRCPLRVDKFDRLYACHPDCALLMRVSVVGTDKVMEVCAHAASAMDRSATVVSPINYREVK